MCVCDYKKEKSKIFPQMVVTGKISDYLSSLIGGRKTECPKPGAVSILIPTNLLLYRRPFSLINSFRFK